MQIAPVCQVMEQRKIKVAYAVPCPLFVAKCNKKSALDKTAYSVTGRSVLSVSTVQDEYRSVVLTVDSDLVGTETLGVSDLVNTLGEEVSFSGLSLIYPTPAPIFSPNGNLFGSNVSNSEASIRKGLNPALDGVNVRALIVSLANGEAFNKRNNRLAISQSYIATASGSFLDVLGSGYGVERPPLLGLDDESYRYLLTSLSTGSQTNKVMWDILRAFYGVSAVHAYVQVVLDGSNPTGKVDLIWVDDRQIEVTYQSSDFKTPVSPMVQEVCVVLNRCFRINGVSAVAQVGKLYDAGGLVECLEIYSGAYGLRSKVGVLAGSDYLPVTGVRDIYSDGAINAAVVSFSGPQNMDVVLPATTVSLSRSVDVGWYGSDTGIEIPDGYLFDSSQTYSVASKQVELAQSLYPGAYYEYVSVDAGATIDPAGGELVFGFGSDGSAVVKYLSYDSATNKLRLSPAVAFPVAALSGAVIYQIEQGFADHTGIGMTYVSDTVSSKTYAEQFIREYASTGTQVNVTISYPDDYSGVEFVYG